MANPLLENHPLPPFGEIEAGHMLPAITGVLEEIRVGIEALLKERPATFSGLVKGREALEDRLHRVFSPIAHLNAVMNTPDVRAAYEQCLSLVTDYYTDVGQNQPLFEAYQAIRDSDEFDTLSGAEQKVVDNALRDFRLSGVDLEAEDKARFAALSRELSSLGTTFSNNVLDATQAWQKHLPSDDRLAGVPSNARALMQQKAAEHDKEGWLLTLDVPCYLAIVTYAEDRDLREEIYTAFGTRASHLGPHAGQFDNSDVMTAILEARLAQARLLGFENFAEMSVATKMARNTDEVLGFLDDLAGRSRLSAGAELEEIQAFASGESGPMPLMPWDVPFYAEKLKKRRYDISDEELRPYFPAPTVLAGMFEVVRRLFDIDVVQVTDMPVWHQDVMTFEIRREGAAIARFYIDLYARSGKQGGAWMDDCRVRRVDADGLLHLPVAYLTCNFSGPVGNNPALLSHDEVVTLFHEFGHGLHHMMTRVDVAAVSGINGVAWDAVELPSQFMENFCWEAESLAFISGHFEDGQPLPVEMLEKLLKARNFQAAMMMVRQLEFALFDFRLHLEFSPGSEGQIQAILDEVRAEVAVISPPPVHAFQHGFSHIFGGGYAAGYYSYKWAEVLSADAFDKFLEEGLFNRQTGEKFLATILEKGGSEDAMDLFVAFRGREPDVDALLRHSGIAA